MNRQSLLELIRQSLGGTATIQAAKLSLSAVLQAIQDGLKEDGYVRLARFGIFETKRRQPRRLLHPLTHQEQTLPHRYIPVFSASKYLHLKNEGKTD